MTALSIQPRSFSIGRVCFGLALLLFGIEHILRGRISPGLPPLPPFLGNGHALALGMGLFLLIIGTLLMASAALRITALTAGAVLLLSACTHLLHPHAALLEGSPRTVFCEALALAACALALSGTPRRFGGAAGEPSVVLLARVIFALTMLVFGVQHFEFLRFVATLVPAWIPNHSAWVIATGVGLVAAGVALLTKIATRAACFGLAAMFFGWLLVLHGPRIATHPHSGEEWASGFVVLALGGGALAMAAVVPDRLSR